MPISETPDRYSQHVAVILGGEQMLIDGPGQSRSSVIEALRSATCSRHASLAARPAMVRLFAADYTRYEYQAHLGRMLGLFEPLERAAAQAAGTSQFPTALRRSKDLRDDLNAMGVCSDEVDALERCPYVPAIPTAGLHGYLYVVLGSMLGGQIIIRRLRSLFGEAASYRFYGGGEPQSYESHWKAFCSDIEQCGTGDLQIICATAVQVFDIYAAWL